jgi:hypothetical protein
MDIFIFLSRRRLMRNISRFIACILIAVLVFSLFSCTGYSEDVAEKIEEYLENEYPGRKFAVLDYEKHNETSGRYEINVRCLDDGVEFMMFMYNSIAVTDGYSVERANSMMESAVREEIGNVLSKKIESVSWYNIYADRATNYRFREIDLAESFSVAALKEINEIELSASLGAEDVAETIYDFIYELCGEEKNLEISRAEFVFKVNRVTYRFTTDSKAVLALGKDGVLYCIINNIDETPSSLREIEFEYFYGDTEK